MSPQEQAYYAEMVKRLIQPPGMGPTDHPTASMRDLGAEKGVPRKPGVSMFSQAEAADNEAADQSAANYAELDKAIAAAKDPSVKMVLEKEKQRLLFATTPPEVKPYTGDSGRAGLTNNPMPPGEFDAAVPPPAPQTPVYPAPSTPMNGPPAPDPWAIPSGPVPPPAPQLAPPAAPGAPAAAPAPPIAPSPPVPPAAPQAPVAAAPAPAAPIPAPVPPAGAMPAEAAQSGQPPGGMDPWASAAQPIPKDIMPGPPQTPEERDRRASGWKNFMQRLQTDPQLQALMLKMGTQMMQPIQPGQTSAGHFGAALQSGVDYAAHGSEMRRKASLEGKKDIREETALSTDVRVADQGIVSSKGQESRAQSKHGPELEGLAARLRQAKTADEGAQIEIDIARWKSLNRAKIGEAELEDTLASARLKNSQAGYYDLGHKANAADAKRALTQKGAAEAVKYFDNVVAVENKRRNTGKTPGSKGYETLEKTTLDILQTLPTGLQAIMKARTDAAGGGEADSPEATSPHPGDEPWTEDRMQQYLDGLKTKKTSPSGSSSTAPHLGSRWKSDN